MAGPGHLDLAVACVTLMDRLIGLMEQLEKHKDVEILEGVDMQGAIEVCG